MQTDTGQWIKCPVCGRKNKMWLNAKGHIHTYCRDCHTTVFFNRPLAIQLAESKGMVFNSPREAVQQNG